ncbi:unnamed protein product [Microthlaspi erraticum]|uniref:KIB1-4 beta-propeller domain-containing protein n=1 Tax=Microthlaspi erraticum TaxID=1685480 RepID=A0A6D2IDG0_9BRAS|nr:unnamed protein product [Microthlaspi erraticum]
MTQSTLERSLAPMTQSTLKRSLDCPDPDPDSQRAKAPRSTLNLRPKSGSPLLMLSLLLVPGRRLSSKLVIVDVFSEERIGLPPLESLKGERFKVEVAGDKKFNVSLIEDASRIVQDVEDLRGLLVLQERDGHYREINTRVGPRLELQGLRDMVLKGYSLYVLTKRDYIRHLDLSGEDGFKDVSENHRLPRWEPNRSTKEEYERLRAIKVTSRSDSIVVKTSGEVLYVHSRSYETSTLERPRTFRVFKRDPKQVHPSTNDDTLAEVDSLGDEALFLDLGITVKVAAGY